MSENHPSPFKANRSSKYPDKIFKTEFANNVQYTEAATARKPINYYLSTSKQAETMRDFMKEVLINIELNR